MSIGSDRTDQTSWESGISESPASAGRGSHSSSLQSLDDRFGVLVVGAGSAGAVLAARLSEDPRRSVLLLEAGRDFPDLKTMPADLNHPDTATGVGPRPINNVGGLRLSTAVTDLHQARGRPTLTIRADVLVRRVLVRGSGLSAWRPSAGRGIIAFFSVPDGISLELYQAPAPQASRPTAQCRHRGIHRSGTAPRQMDERGLETV